MFRWTLAALAALALTTLLAQTAYAQPKGWLADDANILGDQDEQTLREAIEKTYTVTGTRICVRTITSNNGEDVKHIAVRTLNEWGPGTKSIMLLVCLDPRKIYVQPGTDLKYVFNEDVATGIARNTIAPHLKAGNHCAGFVAGIDAIRGRLLTPETQAPAPSAPWTLLGFGVKGWLIIVAVILLVIFLIWVASKSRGSYGNSSGGSSFFYYSGGSSSGSSSSSSYDSGGSSDSGSSGSCDGGGGGGSAF